MEDELEQMMQEALDEAKGLDSDADGNEDQQEEPTDMSDDSREDEDSGENTGEDEEDSSEENDRNIDEDEDTENNEGEHEDSTDDSDTHDDESTSNFEPIEVEVGGQTISIDSKEEMMAFIKKGATSLNPKKVRKSANDQIIEQGKVSQDDLQLFIDAKNGNKAALAKIAKNASIDIYDLNEEDVYTPEFQPQVMTEIDEIADDIMSNDKLYSDFKNVSSTVPQDFMNEVATNPKALRNFASHIETGLAQKIIPAAMKKQLISGGSFMEHYATIGREMSLQKDAKPEDSKTKRKENPRAEKLRTRAKNHKGSNKGTKTKVTGDDIWNMSDEDFKKQYM